MNHTIKTSDGIAILGVLFLFSIVFISHTTKQLDLVSKYIGTIEPNTQTAAISGAGSGLIAHYTFDDGTASDSSGNGNNGTVNGNTAVVGKMSQALSFNGTDSYITINSNPISNYASANSVCAWVKPSDLSSSGGTYRTILNFSADTNNYTRIAVQNNSNLTVAYTAGGVSYGQAAIGSPITSNSWNHICSVFNGSTLSIYINSASEADLADSASNGAVNYIGARGGGIGFWNGLIDDIRVYNRALQASEIQEIYNFSGNDEGELPSPLPPSPGVEVGGVPPPPPQPSPPLEPTPPPPDSPIKTAASCSNSDIQNLINLASDGDTILVPSGNCTWSPKGTGLPAVSFNEKSINLKGAGIDKTVITFIGGTSYAWPHSREGGISITGSSMKSFSISGFTFRSDVSSVTELIGIYGPWRNWRVHNNKFNLIGSRALIINGLSDNTYGLIDHNIFAPPNPGQSMVIKNSASGGAGPAGTKDWLLPSSLGTEQAVYLEDNVFDSPVSPTSFVGAVLDCDYGGRFVARYNRITNTHITNHGGLEYANDDYARGCRQFEIYNNTFESQGGKINDRNAIGLRGGNGVIFNNTVIGEYGKWASGVTLGFYCYSAKANLCNGARADDENLPGQSGRHCRDCAGVGQDLGAYPSKQMTDPVYLWNNTHNGLPATVGTDAPKHILIGTDILNNTPRPGYTPYTYPHPLQNKEKIIIPSPALCTSFTYSVWSICVNSIQTRAVTISSPSGCTGGSPITTQSCVVSPSSNTIDDDTDGILNTIDLCPHTPVGKVVNQKGCPLPKASKFNTIDLSNVNLNSVPSFEVSNTFGKISFTSPVSLVKNDTILDIDSNLSIAKGIISLDSTHLPELNKPATLTFYNVTISSARLKIMKDGVLCNGCSVVSYSNNTLVISVPGFSTYSILDEEDPVLPPVVVTPPTSSSGGGNSGGGSGRRSSNSLPRTAVSSVVGVSSTTISTPTSPYTFTRYLTVGSTGTDVKVLQQSLNSLGYTVSASGVGSSGQETTYYGPSTTLALQKFQCATLKVCSGSPTTNGYGNFGPQTRAALNSRISSAVTATNTRGVNTSSVCPPGLICTPLATLGTSTSLRSVTVQFTRSLTVGDTGNDVKQLQIFLNSHPSTSLGTGNTEYPFRIATTGPGSLGNETTYYGNLTAQAVSKFQEYYKSEILTPVNLNQGTGFFGASTIRKVNALNQ